MKFSLNKPFETDQSAVEVDAGLPPGAYRFRLVVVNKTGRRSAPAEVVVTIQERTITPPVILNPGIVTPPVLVIGGVDRLTPPVTPPPAPPTPRRPRRPSNPSPP